MKKYQQKKPKQAIQRDSRLPEKKNRANYRRGQTISGYKKEDSERTKARTLVLKRRKISGILVFILSCAVFILFILSQLVIKVDFYSQDGKKIEDQSSYQSVVDEYYQNHPIERMRIFLNGDNLLSTIQSKLPEVEAINSIDFKELTYFKVTLDMRQPVASWSVNGKDYFVDSTGVAFSTNYFSKPEINVSDESGINIGKDHIVASNGFLGFIGKIIGSAKTNSIEIDRIVIPPSSLRQVQVYAKNISYPAIFLTSESPELQVRNFSRAIKYFQTNSLNPQYVDFRVEGKAFYK